MVNFQHRFREGNPPVDWQGLLDPLNIPGNYNTGNGWFRKERISLRITNTACKITDIESRYYFSNIKDPYHLAYDTGPNVSAWGGLVIRSLHAKAKNPGRK
jgi:hypothetical protein